MNNEIKELQCTIDGLMKLVYELATQQQILTSMVLGVYEETMKPEDYKSVYTIYVDRLEARSNEMLDELEKTVYNKHQLVHHRFECFSTIQDLKRSDDYKRPEELGS